MAQNNILLYASSAKATNTTSNVNGAYLYDSNWASSPDRQSGAKLGIASSVQYNTVLRQASLMARTLGQILINRGSGDVSAQVSFEEASASTDDVVLQQRVQTFSDLFTSDNFLKDSEVKTKHIAKQNVTTSCIADQSITVSKLNNLIVQDKGTTSQNGITVQLSQSAGSGFDISLTSDSVTYAENVRSVAASGSFELMGRTQNTEASLDYAEYASTVYRSNLYVDSSGTLHNAGNAIEASSYNATSDKRLKQDIVPISFDASRIVENVDVFEFEYKDAPDIKQIGMIAQDLEEYCPNLVVTGDDGYLRIKESKLIYVLWKSLHDANRRIDILESQIKALYEM